MVFLYRRQSSRLSACEIHLCLFPLRLRICSSMSVMRSSSPPNLETAIMSDKTARSAASLTDSDAALSPSLTILSAAHLARLDIRPTARSMARRRIRSTAARTPGSHAHLWAVRLGTLFLLAHFAALSPWAIAMASWVFGDRGISYRKARLGARW